MQQYAGPGKPPAVSLHTLIWSHISTPTYLPSQKVKTLIDQNPNVTEVAKRELNNRYTNGTNRNNINDVLNQHAEDAADNVTDRTEEEITLIQDERQQYLDSLAG